MKKNYLSMGLVAVLGSCSEELIIQNYAPASGYDVKIECDNWRKMSYVTNLNIFDLAQQRTLFKGIAAVEADDYDGDGRVDKVQYWNIPKGHTLEKFFLTLELNKLVSELAKECHKK